MTGNFKKKFLLTSTVSLVLLLILSGVSGIFIPDFYSKEPFNWQVQSLAQDFVDLFLIVPLFAIVSVLAIRKPGIFERLRGGIVLYILYTYVIFCFAVHFNELFIVYCLILGLSLYSFVYFLFEQVRSIDCNAEMRSLIYKFTGMYFIITSVCFTFLWLAEIIPPVLKNTVPDNLRDTGLFTNPVHVIDLSAVLPGIFITGILLLRKNKLGYKIAPAVLVFFILMEITIGVIIVFMNLKRLESDITAAIAMGILAVISLVLLGFIVRNQCSQK